MRKTAFLLLLIVILPVSYAAVYGKHHCADPACLQGTDINFSVLIHNNLKDNIVIDNIYIKDVESGIFLAVDARKETIILPNELRSFTLPSTVQAPEEGYTFYYVPCFSAKSFDNNGYKSSGEVCGKKIRALTVIPDDEVKCRKNAECVADEYCNTFSLYKCKPLDCQDNENIIDHSCSALSCNSLQYAKGHKCRYNPALLIGVILAGLIIIALAVAVHVKK